MKGVTQDPKYVWDVSNSDHFESVKKCPTVYLAVWQESTIARGRIGRMVIFPSAIIQIRNCFISNIYMVRPSNFILLNKKRSLVPMNNR